MLQRNNTIGGLGKRTTDPNEKKTWDVAKKLGVAQELNLASEDVRRDFANGVKNAANVVKFKNLDTDHPDVLKYTEALIKKSLEEPIQDETPWVKAMEDAKTALLNSKAKVYQSPSLKSYMKLRQTVDRASDERTIYDNINLVNKQKQYDEKLTFKEKQLVDHIHEDQYINADEAENMNNTEHWYNKDTLQGIGITANGEIIAGKNVSAADRALLQLKFLYDQDSIKNEYKKMLLHKMLTIKKANPDSKIKITDSLERFSIPDVTEDMHNHLFSYEYMYGENNKYGWLLMLPTFYDQVRNGSGVDLKNQKQYQDHEVFLYDGEYVSRDALGNIFYGYLGKCYDIPDEVLFRGAGFAQVASGFDNTKLEWKDYYFDDPRDVERIQQGIDFYNRVHADH